jgi:hypothetical protein
MEQNLKAPQRALRDHMEGTKWIDSGYAHLKVKPYIGILRSPLNPVETGAAGGGKPGG